VALRVCAGCGGHATVSARSFSDCGRVSGVPLTATAQQLMCRPPSAYRSTQLAACAVRGELVPSGREWVCRACSAKCSGCGVVFSLRWQPPRGELFVCGGCKRRARL